MNTQQILDLAKRNPTIVQSVLDFIVNATKTDPTLLEDLLDLAAGNLKGQDVLKAHSSVVFQLLSTLLPVIGPTGLEALLKAL